MKIFIDSADLDEIREAYSWGIIDGITTNPSLMAKALKNQGKPADSEAAFKEYLEQILNIAGGDPVSLEVTGLTEEQMYEQAMKLYDLLGKYGIGNSIAIKVPVNPDPEGDANFDGLRVTKRLFNLHIPVNVTLVMSPEQALLAANAGATYVSPFAGRIDDYLRQQMLGWAPVTGNPQPGEFRKSDYYPAEGMKDDKGIIIHNNGIVSGVDLVAQIVEIFDLYSMPTEIIAASIRNARQVRELAQTGVHIATVPYKVLEQMIIHPLTAEGVRNFSADVPPAYRALIEQNAPVS